MITETQYLEESEINFPVAHMEKLSDSIEDPDKFIKYFIEILMMGMYCKFKNQKITDDNFDSIKHYFPIPDLHLIDIDGFKCGIENGKYLYEKYTIHKKLLVGIKFNIIDSVICTEKEQFTTVEERATLVLFLATQSIIGEEPYARMGWDLMLSRMRGYLKKQQPSNLNLKGYLLKIYKSKSKIRPKLIRNLVKDYSLKYLPANGYVMSYKLDIAALEEAIKG